MTAAAGVRGATLWFAGASFTSAALQYGLFFLVARLLGVEAYGGFSLALTVAVLAVPWTDLGTSVALVRTGSQTPERTMAAFAAALRLRLCAALPVGLAALGIGFCCGYGADFVWLFVPLYLAALLDGVAATSAAVCHAERRARTAAGLLLSRNGLRAVALAVMLLADGGAIALAWAFASGSLLGAAVGLRVAAAGRALDRASSPLLSTVREAWPFGAAVLATIVHGQIDVAVIGAACGPADVGRYHAAMRLLLLVQMVPQALSSASAPLAYRAAVLDPKATARLLHLKLVALGWLGALIALCLACAGDLVTDAVLGERFAGSGVFLIALAPVVFVRFVSQALADTLTAVGRLGFYCRGAWLACAANVLGNLWFVPSHGPLAAAAVALASETLLLVWSAMGLGAAGVPVGIGQRLRRPLLAISAGALPAALLSPLAGPVAAIGCAVLACCGRPTGEERALLRRSARGARAAASPAS